MAHEVTPHTVLASQFRLLHIPVGRWRAVEKSFQYKAEGYFRMHRNNLIIRYDPKNTNAIIVEDISGNRIRNALSGYGIHASQLVARIFPGITMQFASVEQEFLAEQAPLRRLTTLAEQFLPMDDL